MTYQQVLVRVCLLLWVSQFAVATQAQPALQQFREHTEAPQNRPDDEPELNPHPEKALVLKVHKDAKIEIWFDLLYSTTNQACLTQSLIGRIAGAPNVPQAIYDSVRAPVGKTRFSARFLLDRYLPGKCGWQPMGLGHAEFDPSVASSPIVHGGVAATRTEGSNSLRFTLACRRMPPDRSHFQQARLRCNFKDRFSPEMTTLSTGGGLVEIEVTLEPDSDAS